MIAAHGINLASQPLLSRIPALTLAESYARGDAYEYGAAFDRAAARRAWRGAGRSGSAATCSRSQDRGLDRLAERRAVLRERYAAFDHPAAREIVAWLDGYWNVTDELVQTQ